MSGKKNKAGTKCFHFILLYTCINERYLQVHVFPVIVSLFWCWNKADSVKSSKYLSCHNVIVTIMLTVCLFRISIYAWFSDCANKMNICLIGACESDRSKKSIHKAIYWGEYILFETVIHIF